MTEETADEVKAIGECDDPVGTDEEDTMVDVVGTGWAGSEAAPMGATWLSVGAEEVATEDVASGRADFLLTRILNQEVNKLNRFTYAEPHAVETIESQV